MSVHVPRMPNAGNGWPILIISLRDAEDRRRPIARQPDNRLYASFRGAAYLVAHSLPLQHPADWPCDIVPLKPLAVLPRLVDPPKTRRSRQLRPGETFLSRSGAIELRQLRADSTARID